jgi:hypothetical protein
MQPGDLPSFDAESTYLIRGETLNTIMDYIKEKTIVIVEGSGLKVDEIGPDGTKISIDGTNVCP